MDEVTLAATTVAATFLTRATEEVYERVRDAVGRLIRRGDQPPGTALQLERLDRHRVAVTHAPAGDRDTVLQAAALAWAPVLDRLAESEPAVYAELLALARQNAASSVVNQHNHGEGTFINGNVEGGVTINVGAARTRHG
ncbi:hypothetical protein [Actinacidiphila alni]|uniref:hypothetical protein n=1 Tax=Actinacidiphila alni TaxID=380248 RepID=UPI00345183C7